LHKILIIYFSRHGSVARMAEQISLGVDSIQQCEPVLRCLPEVSTTTEQVESAIPDHGVPYAQLADLQSCDALIVGSPGYFGNMAAPLKYFFDSTSSLCLSGAMIGKPGAVFTATSRMHGGQETVLTSMMLPLLHHGMIIAGLPYSEPGLMSSSSGGTPYGASHWAGEDNSRAVDAGEASLCKALGSRVARIAGGAK